MRIIHITHSFYPDTGGIENHIYELARELSKKNEVVVYAAGRERRDYLAGKVLVRNYPSFRIPFTPVNASPWLAIALLFEKGDVFHSHGFFSPYPLLAAKLAWLKGKPFVFTIHGYPKPSGAVHSLMVRLYAIFAAPIFLSLAKKIITVSEKDTKKLARYRRKITFIPNGVNRTFSCKKPFASQNHITYIGRLSEDKRIGVLISAFSKLKGRKLALRICGKDFGARKGLEKLAQETGDDVEFFETPYGQMPGVYCNSKAVVLPSEYEGMPLVWLEAIACSRPIFSARVGGAEKFFSELFGKNAEKFLFNDEDELLGKLGAFLKDERKYAPMVAKARKIILKEFSWSKAAARTEKAYKGAVGQG